MFYEFDNEEILKNLTVRESCVVRGEESGFIVIDIDIYNKYSMTYVNVKDSGRLFRAVVGEDLSIRQVLDSFAAIYDFDAFGRSDTEIVNELIRIVAAVSKR